jgi:hypothetical protein
LSKVTPNLLGVTNSLKPAFRNPATGEVVTTTPIHDVDNPGVQTWESKEDGYVNADGKFLTREEAKPSSEPAEGVKPMSKSEMPPEMLARIEQIAQTLESLIKSEKHAKAIIPPGNEAPSTMSAGGAVEDIPPGEVNPPGTAKSAKTEKAEPSDKAESLDESEAMEMSKDKCAKCGELFKADGCSLAKCGKIEAPIKKAETVFDSSGNVFVQGINPKARLPGDGIAEIAAPGSGGQIKKGSLKALHQKIAKGDFGMGDSGKAHTLPPTSSGGDGAKPKFTMEHVKQQKQALAAQGIKPKPGIFGRTKKK